MKNKKILGLIPILVLVLAACAPTTAEAPTIEVPTEPMATEAMTTEPMVGTPTVGVPVTGEATVDVSETADFGPILVDSEGSSLYMFEADTQNSGASTCYDDCAESWPPLLIDGPPVAGEGVDEFLLATLPRDDGSTQVTYNGWPLYYYAGDTAPGDTAGQGIDGFGGLWWLIAPSGEPITE
jgi:predicted lipoprotein with Yx(FWY)xxD motif